MKKAMLFGFAIFAIMISGCHHRGWDIHQTEVTVSGTDGLQSAQEAILLDASTGESWILSPQDGFYWRKLKKE